MDCVFTDDLFDRFVKHPEFLKEGQRLVFREGRTKAVGNVTKIIPYVPAIISKDKEKKSQNQQRQRQQGSGVRDNIVTLPQPTQA